MTRAQVRRLSGRLVLLHEGYSPAGWSGEPAVILGATTYGHLYVGWVDDIGWPLSGGDGLFDGHQGCLTAWAVSPCDVDLLPPGAAVARGAK